MIDKRALLIQVPERSAQVVPLRHGAAPSIASSSDGASPSPSPHSFSPPIEQLFAKLKHLLRKAGERTIDAVCNAIGQILGTITPQECRNYFTQAGYDRR